MAYCGLLRNFDHPFMETKESHKLSPATHSTAIFVAKAIFYNGLLLGFGFFVAAMMVVFSETGNFAVKQDRYWVGGVFAVLSVISFAMGWGSRSRIAKLKLKQ